MKLRVMEKRSGGYSYPRIEVGGAQLRRAGFKPGEEVEVYIGEGLVVVAKPGIDALELVARLLEALGYTLWLGREGFTAVKNDEALIVVKARRAS